MTTTTTVTTTYLAQRANRQHRAVRLAAESAIRRGAEAEFTPTRTLMTTLADNFALSRRIAGRNREDRIHQLAARLRAIEAEQRHAAA